MKKTLTINLNGVIFTIDEDAYEALQQYLLEIEKHFPTQEDREILSDIETRIAELFSEILRSSRSQVISIENVETVITTLGHPEQFDEAEEPTDENRSSKNESSSSKDNGKSDRQSRKQFRKFYRDIDNQLIGGVGSGLAAYLGMDVTLVRIIMLLLMFVSSGWIIPAYLIIWIIAPGANSTAQKLEMNGIEPSIENIKRYIESDEFKSSATRIGNRLAQIFMWCFKALAIFVGICISAGGLFFVTTILIAVISVLAGSGNILFKEVLPFLNDATPALIIWAISTIMIILIPILSIIITTIKLIRRDGNPLKPHDSAMGWAWFAVWIIAVITCIVTLSEGKKIYHTINHDNISQTYSSIYNVTEERLVGERFNTLKVSSGLKVRLQPDTVSFVEITGTENGLRSTVASISGKTLSLHVKKSGNGIELPFITVHHTDLTSIKATSAANISNNRNTCLRTENLDLDASSAARINLTIECKNVDIKTSSAAKIETDGFANRVTANSSSASKIDIEHLHADYARISASSASNVELRADTLNIKATSGATIEYYGNPVIESIDSNSGGNIKSSRE